MMTRCFVFAIVWLTTPLFAQTDQDIKSEPLPPGPILATVPDNIQWNIQYTYLKSAPNGGAISKVTFTKTGKFVHQLEVDFSGLNIERWSDGQLEAAWPKGLDHPYISMGSVSPNNNNPDPTPPGMIINLNQNPLEDFSWVSPQNYLGVKIVNEQDCYVFRQATGGGVQTAYIDKQSHYPVRLDDPDLVRLYDFEDPDVRQQSFPPSVQQFLNVISSMEGGQSTRSPR